MAAEIKDLIRRQALASGLDPNVMVRIAQIESGLNPNAKNPNSSASGLFQFINSTGRQYGLTNPFDAEQNTAAAMRFTSDNVSGLKRMLGRDPTPGEIYLAHQQGLGGAKQLLANPDVPAARLVGEKAVTLNAGNSGMSARDFAGLWDNKMNRVPTQPPQTAQPRPTPITPEQANSLGMSQADMIEYNKKAAAPPLPPPVNVAPRPIAGDEDPAAVASATPGAAAAFKQGDRMNLPGGGMGTYSHGGLAIADNDTMGRYSAVSSPDGTNTKTPEFLASLAQFLRGNA